VSGKANPRVQARAPRDGDNITQLARELGVNRDTINEWKKKGWLVKSPSGSYYDREATRARVNTYRTFDRATLKSSDAASVADLPPELLALSPEEVQRRLKAAQMRQAEADASIAETKLSEQQGALVPATDADRACRSFGAMLRDALDCAVETGAVDAHARWSAPLAEVREWLRNWYETALHAACDRAEQEESCGS